MRLRDIRELLSNNLPNLTKVEFGNVQGNNLYPINNYREAIESINNLGHFNFISVECENIKPLSVYIAQTQSILVGVNEYNQFKGNIGSIIAKIETALSIIDQVIPSQNEFSVSIKLPPIKELSKLSEITKDISNALNQTLLHPSIKGKVDLQNFDTGSNWLEVLLGNKEAFIFVGSLVWSALEVHKKMIENGILKQRLKSLQIKNNTLENLDDALSKALEQEIADQCQDSALKIIEQNNLPKTDHEYNSKVSHSIKTIAQLIFDGAEFHQPTISQSDSKQLFPDFKNLNQLESSIKELTDNSTDQES